MGNLDKYLTPDPIAELREYIDECFGSLSRAAEAFDMSTPTLRVRIKTRPHSLIAHAMQLVYEQKSRDKMLALIIKAEKHIHAVA